MEKVARAIVTPPVAGTLPNLVTVSAVIATRNRAVVLERTLRSLAAQSVHPAEIILADASDDDSTGQLYSRGIGSLTSALRYHRTKSQGAASQRNEGVALARTNVIWFFDDDILFEPECVARLWNALEADPKLGGVNAMITNQRYLPPGAVSRLLFRFLNGRGEASYAGRCIGPGLNMLPEDRGDMPAVVPVEWLNTTCVMYRREALPSPAFPPHFTGYSFGEDVTLSLTVGKRWALANARTARIIHDSQPADHKGDRATLAEMELVNRYYIMREVRGQRGLGAHAKLAVMESFNVIAQVRMQPRVLPSLVRGKSRGLWKIIRGRAFAK